jgi:hypothetical protein
VRKIPRSFPVRPLRPTDAAQRRMSCGHCGRSWDDAIATSYTPAPSARCPFEDFHNTPRARSRHKRDTLPVLFRFSDGEVVAVFPTFPGTCGADFTVYAHVGQHSVGTFGWYYTTRRATPEEYAPLLKELRRIYESEPGDPALDVRQRFTSAHDKVRRAEAAN